MLAALLFHGLLIGGALSYALIVGLFPHHITGTGGEGETIAVQLVSNALPLPSDEKPNDNVLSTENPSEAPAPPTPKAAPTVDQTAIPIPTKLPDLKKPDQKKQETSKAQVPTPPTPTKPLKNQPPTKPDPRAQFGEQSSSRMDRSAQVQSTTVGQATVTTAGGHGFPYPFYIEAINRKIHDNTYRGEVDPRTPVGTQANIQFIINRDGSLAGVKMERSGGSPTLDRACLRAAQRVDSFGPLPSPPSEGNLGVSYHCDY